MSSKPFVRKALRLTHLWLGVAGGALVCLMSMTGAVVTLRPTLAQWMAPATTAPHGCGRPVDWGRAEQQIIGFTHRPINRLYAFDDGDPRWHVRVATDKPIIFEHVIYDACAGEVLGAINLSWMDWLVDLHHNLLAGRTGRTWAGAIGVALLVSAISGVLFWWLGRPRWATVFRIQRASSAAGVSREWHRAIGLGAMCVLVLESYTALWLCFPQAMRGTLNAFVSVPVETRPPRAPKTEPAAPPVDLATVMASAQRAMPDGAVREIRLPDGYGNVQVRMWRPGDFRSLGNNVVTVANATGRVAALDRYGDKAGSQRFIQAMAGLHYGEWGGLGFRLIYFVAGLATLLLFATGLVIWWAPMAREKARARFPQPSRSLS